MQMTKQTSINVDRFTIKQFAIALLFVIPYLETGPLYYAFTNSNRTYYWRSILSFQIILFVVLIMRHGKSRITGKYSKSVFLISAYLLINGVLSLVLGADMGALLVTLLSFVIPLANSNLVLKDIDKEELRLEKIIKWSINLYVLFVIYCIVFNIAKYGLVLSYVNNRFRLSASAGGPVILGYTISLVFVYMLANKDLFTFKNLVFNSVVFVLAVTYTMDRGAYVILLLGVFYLVVTEKNKIISGVFVLGVIFGIIYFSDELFGKLIKTLFGNRVMSTDITETMRFVTAMHCLSDYIKEPLYYLTGHGIGNFFPFQQWTASNAGISSSAYARFDVNLFSYKGNMILVQPHNTIIYLLMETGAIGIVLFLRTSFVGMKNDEGQIQSNVLVVVTAFLLLALMESTIIVQPGIACMWWLMVGLTKKRFGTLK